MCDSDDPRYDAEFAQYYLKVHRDQTVVCHMKNVIKQINVINIIKANESNEYLLNT